MLDKLVQLFIDFITLAKFWFVCDPWEYAVVLTFGQPTRDIGPKDGVWGTGFHLHGPLNIEVVQEVSVQDETTNLTGQDLLARDGSQVRVEGMFSWRVNSKKIRQYIFTVGEEESFVADHLQAAVAVEILNIVTKKLKAKPLEKKIRARARKLLEPFGITVTGFHFVSLTTPKRSFRFITGP